MKNYNFRIMTCLMIAGIVVIFSACDHNAVEPQAHVVMLKFKKTEYKNHILATHSEGSDYIVATRFNKCGEPCGQAGYSPYWDLPDNWLLVDWKWRNFPYTSGAVLLTERTWEEYPFETSPLPKWSITEPQVLQPIEKIYYIKATNLAKYNQTTYSKELLGFIEELGAGDNCACNRVEWADSLWSIIQLQLSSVILNKDIEKVSH
ncbi:MAG: hypothetical protein IKM83_02415 [Paludibacteraceae bacterium]|nr:hypothetical protein [Paludibacteraceae bacterium]